MTDNEIIKALECCHNEDCDNCPLRKYPKSICRWDAYDYALDLINRQKEEIERLKLESAKTKTVKSLADEMMGE